MNYKYLHVFYTVAVHENLSKAAEVLGVTQPAVSRIISNIEKSFNTKLFNRSKNGVTLTRDGLNLFRMIEIPLNELEKVSYNLNEMSSLKENIIHVGATAMSLYCYIFNYKIFNRLRTKYPNIQYRIYTDSSKNLMKLVEQGKIDFAFITTPSPTPATLEVTNIFKIDLSLIASPSFEEDFNSEVSIKDLAKYPFVLLNRDTQFRDHIDSFLNEHNLTIEPRYELESSALLIPFLENEASLTFVPTLMAYPSITNKTATKVNLKEEIPPRFVSFVIKKGDGKREIIKQLRKELFI